MNRREELATERLVEAAEDLLSELRNEKDLQKETLKKMDVLRKRTIYGRYILIAPF